MVIGDVACYYLFYYGHVNSRAGCNLSLLNWARSVVFPLFWNVCLCLLTNEEDFPPKSLSHFIADI